MVQFEDRFLKRIQDEFYKTKNDPTMHWTRKEIRYRDYIKRLGERYSFRTKGGININDKVPSDVVELLNSIVAEKNKLVTQHTGYKIKDDPTK